MSRRPAHGRLGAHLHARLSSLVGHGVREVRGRGLWAGIEIAPGGPTGRAASEALLTRGVLCKETHTTTLRVTPPLLISREDLDRGIDAVIAVLSGDG